MSRDILRNTLENTYANKGLDALKILRQSGYDRDYIEETGPYLAKVLRVEPLVGTDTWVDGAAVNAAIDFDKKGKPYNPLEPYSKSYVVTARISSMEGRQIGIHDYLPEPEQLGTKKDLEGDFKSESAIFNHDSFVPQSLDLPAPELGSYIWVDYLDKQNLADGIYIRPMVPGDSFAFKTKDDPCPPPYPTKGKGANGAATGKGEKNPGLGKNKGQPKPDAVVPKLKGYKLEDFTKSTSFNADPKKQNLLKIVGVAEVITMFFNVLYPKADIKVVAPTTARDKTEIEQPELTPKEAAKFHYTGLALTVEVHKDNTPMPKEEIYAAMMLLILKGKLPPGGLGFFQTNTGDGTNKDKTTTLGTDSKASGFPHYDLREGTGNYWVVSTKDGKQVLDGKVTNINNWINLSKKKRTNLPPHVMTEYVKIAKKMPPSFPNLNTTLAAIEQKEKFPSNTGTPADEKTAGEKPPKTEEKTEKTLPAAIQNKIQLLNIQLAMHNNISSPAAKAQAEKIKAQIEELKKQAKPETENNKENKDKKEKEDKDKTKKDQTPKKVPVAKVPCPDDDGDGGAGAQDLTKGTIGKTAGTPPTNQVKSEKNIMQHIGEKKHLNDYFKKDGNKLTMFVLHYTAGFGTAISVAAKRKKQIEDAIVANNGVNKDIEKTTSYTVHLWMGRAGEWFQQVDFMHKLGHASCLNSVSVGMENILVGFSTSKKTIADRLTAWEHWIGKYGSVAPELFQKGLLGFSPSSTETCFGLPSLAQCEGNYRMCKWLTGFQGLGKTRKQGPYPPKYMNIPMAFPATSSSDKRLSVFNKPAFKNKNVFIWGRVDLNRSDGKGTGSLKQNSSNDFWEARVFKKGSLRSLPEKRQNWHHGIVAHTRFPTHGDGHFFEFYVLGRVLGLSAKDAYFASVAAASHRAVKTHGPLGGRSNAGLTFWPNYKGKTNVGNAKGYVAAGKAMWAMSGLDNTDLNSHCPRTSLFDKAKFEEWRKSKKGQKQLAIAKNLNKNAGWKENTLVEQSKKIGVRKKPVYSV
jgi:hypothetical protein